MQSSLIIAVFCFSLVILRVPPMECFLFEWFLANLDEREHVYVGGDRMNKFFY